LEVPGLHLFSLQKGGTPAPETFQLTDFMDEMVDFADTAALIANLDLVISVDTAVAHLAAALGKPVWLLDRFDSCWRWLRGRQDSPWYPTLRIYRQSHPGEWVPVLAEVVRDLHRLFPDTTDIDSQDGGVVPARADPDSRNSEQESCDIVNNRDGFNALAECRDGPMLYNRNDQYVGTSLRKYGDFSAGEAALFDLIVQPGTTVLEIGANIGAHTVALSRLVGAVGAVYAFEPQRLVFQVLCANLALNSCPNVFTYQAAVGARVGTLLVPPLDPDASNNFGGLSLSGATQGECVPVLTVDGLNLGACDFIKVDVEGMEAEVLRGAAATIKRFRPMLYLENDRAGESAELIGLVQSYGYRLYWHTPPLYDAGNYRDDAENIFGNIVSVNMLCVPTEVPQTLAMFREVTGPTDTWT
jgi:FkbM family methyltransferase